MKKRKRKNSVNIPEYNFPWQSRIITKNYTQLFVLHIVDITLGRIGIWNIGYVHLHLKAKDTHIIEYCFIFGTVPQVLDINGALKWESHKDSTKMDFTYIFTYILQIIRKLGST